MLWKEDELLEAIGLADGRFLDGDENDDTTDSIEVEDASDLGDGGDNVDALPEGEENHAITNAEGDGNDDGDGWNLDDCVDEGEGHDMMDCVHVGWDRSGEESD